MAALLREDKGLYVPTHASNVWKWADEAGEQVKKFAADARLPVQYPARDDDWEHPEAARKLRDMLTVQLDAVSYALERLQAIADALRQSPLAGTDDLAKMRRRKQAKLPAGPAARAK
jgi:hypothetical protein